MRLDKFLWCVRAFKTRSIATQAVRKGRVKLNDKEAKASAEISVGDVVSVRIPPIWRSYRIISIPKSRVGAKSVPELIEETTSWEDLEKLETARQVRSTNGYHGKGRPTKKVRRDMDRNAQK